MYLLAFVGACVLPASSAADAGMWDAQWKPLAERLHVIRVDYRGFGHTPYAAEAVQRLG